jgi:hypothetical protein
MSPIRTLLVTFLVSVSHSVCFAQTAYNPANAIANESVFLISTNPTFESGLQDWQSQALKGEHLTRGFTPYTFNDNIDAYFLEKVAQLGQKLVRVQGVHGKVFGQVVTLPTSTRDLIVNFHGYKKAVGSTGNGGTGYVGLTWYNSSFQELGKELIPVSNRININRGAYDGMQIHSWAAKVSRDAVYGMIWVYAEPGTEVYVDSLALLGFKSESRAPFPKSLLLKKHFSTRESWTSPNYTTFVPGTQNAFYVCLLGNEFWHADWDWSTRRFLDPRNQDGMGYRTSGIGTTTRAESAWQFVNVVPGRTYSLFGNFESYSKTPAAFGIDFFDANWRKIGDSIYPLGSQTDEFIFAGKRVVVPANTARASVWVWTDKIPVGNNLDHWQSQLYLIEQAPVSNNDTSAVVYDSFSTFPSKGGGIAAFGILMLYSDAQGLDTTSLDVNDIKFASKSVSGKTYPCTSMRILKSSDSDKLISVIYYADPSVATDAAAVIVNPNQVKDKTGSFAPSTTIKVIP